jgi:hypothetical protein
MLRVDLTPHSKPLGTTFSSSNAVEEVRTFNGDRTGTFTTSTAGSSVLPTVGFSPSANSTKGSASFSYTVADDTFTAENVPGTFKGTVLTGTRVGQTFKIDGIPKATGLISAAYANHVTCSPRQSEGLVRSSYPNRMRSERRSATKDASRFLHGPTNAYFRAPDTVRFGDAERRPVDVKADTADRY